MFSVVDMLDILRCCAADYLHRARHPDVAVARDMAAPAAYAGHREFTLYEVVSQLPEEPPVAPVVDRLARVVTPGHAREARKRAGVPGAHPFDFVFPHFPVADGEAGAGRTDVGARPALQAAVADLFEGLVHDLPAGDVADCGGEPAGGG